MLDIGTDRFSLILVAETLILLFQLFHYLSRRRDRSRLLFLFLVASFVIFNVISYLLHYAWHTSHIVAIIVSYFSCLVLSVFHVIYVVNEFEFREEIMSFSKIALGIGTCLFTSYIASHFLFGASEIARTTLVALPLFITSILSVYINLQIKSARIEMRRQGIPFKTLLYASYGTLILISAVPIFTYFDQTDANLILLNVAFAGLVIGYYQRLLSKNIDESEFFDNSRLDLKEFALTKRQLEVAQHMLSGLSYEEIGKSLHIAEGTVSKHASDIFKRTGCVSGKREEFVQKFGASA